jgi:GTP pyrophosphokinase
VAQLLGHDKLDDFLAAVGMGDVNSTQIANRILEMEQRERQQARMMEPKPSSPTLATDSTSGIDLGGMSGLLMKLAQCCNPVQGDPIIGYITRGRGVTIHRRDCSNMRAVSEPERLIEASWGTLIEDNRYPVPVEILAYDREGLMRDISTVIADERVNMSKVQVSTRQHIATLQVTLEIAGAQQLTRILNKIETIPNIIEARRRSMT